MADRQPFNPKTTTFTNLALDEIMPRVSPNAWKVLCVALRKTQGWADADSPTGRKQSDVIAQSQFMILAGIASENTVKSAIAECVAAGYLLKAHEGQSFRYSLNLTYALSDTAEIDTVGTVAEIDTETTATVAEIDTERYQKLHTQTVKNHKDSNTKREGGAKNAPRAPAKEYDPVTPRQRKRYQLPTGPEPTPALKAYLEAANAAQQPQTPCPEVRAAIDAVGDLATWQEHLHTWTMKGYRFANVADLLETFKGGFQTARGNAHGNSASIIKSTSRYTADA